MTTTNPAYHLSEDLRQEIVRHCVAELPNEACGLVASHRDRIAAVYPARNVNPSPTSFQVDPQDHFEALTDAEERGWNLAGVFHSHPRGPAVPSSTDLKEAVERDWLYLVVGMANEPELRAWRIVEGGFAEIDL